MNLTENEERSEPTPLALRTNHPEELSNGSRRKFSADTSNDPISKMHRQTSSLRQNYGVKKVVNAVVLQILDTIDEAYYMNILEVSFHTRIIISGRF